MSDPAIDDIKLLRRALGTFATGVTVVTTIPENGEPRGFTANSFTSVSLDPPLVLVCVSKTAASYPVFSASRTFTISVLAENQQDVCSLFASPGEDRFSQASWSPGRNDCPVIDGAISWFECDTHEVIDAGDHVILIGRVSNHESTNQNPLVYCNGAFVEFGMQQLAMEAASSATSTWIAAVIDCDGMIPMLRDKTSGRLSLPTARRAGNKDDPESLLGLLADAGIGIAMPFVYAVYEDVATKMQNVVYRATGEVADPRSIDVFEMISLDRVPWPDLVDDALRMLLERYIKESKHDAFGVYVGDSQSGEVRTLGAVG